jgi:hypothetical protein
LQIALLCDLCAFAREIEKAEVSERRMERRQLSDRKIQSSRKGAEIAKEKQRDTPELAWSGCGHRGSPDDYLAPAEKLGNCCRNKSGPSMTHASLGTHPVYLTIVIDHGTT